MRYTSPALIVSTLLICVSARLCVAEPEAPKAPVLSAWETANTYIQLSLAGKFEEAAAFGEPGTAPSTPKMAKELLSLQAKSLKIAQVHADGQFALAISESVKDERGRDGVLVFTLVKIEDRWLIRDLDHERPEGLKRELQRFLDEHRDAKPVEAPASK